LDIINSYFSTFDPSDINKVMGGNTQRFYHLNE
jgi:hypothetical protein